MRWSAFRERQCGHIAIIIIKYDIYTHAILLESLYQLHDELSAV